MYSFTSNNPIIIYTIKYVDLFLAETFEPHYGVNGREGDGDVFKETNILAFMDFVLENTGGKGIYLL